MRYVRVILRGLAFVAVCTARFTVLGLLWLAHAGSLGRHARAEWLHRSCRWLVKVLGLRITVEGAVVPSGLLVSNHISYLDICALSSLVACSFVSKWEVRSWPVIGWAASASGTIFLKRERQRDVARARDELSTALQQGELVAIFPESTTTDGAAVLPFRPALFEAAVESAVMIQPMNVAYLQADGGRSPLAPYWGAMTFLPHFLRLLQERELRMQIRFGTAFQAESRAAAAEKAYAAVAALAEQQRGR